MTWKSNNSIILITFNTNVFRSAPLVPNFHSSVPSNTWFVFSSSKTSSPAYVPRQTGQGCRRKLSWPCPGENKGPTREGHTWNPYLPRPIITNSSSSSVLPWLPASFPSLPMVILHLILLFLRPFMAVLVLLSMLSSYLCPLNRRIDAGHPV